MVAGRNFGCGSSREHARSRLARPVAIWCLRKVAPIFFATVWRPGAIRVMSRGGYAMLNTGDEVRVDLDAGTVVNKSTGDEYSIKPLGEVRPVIDAGGLFKSPVRTA